MIIEINQTTGKDGRNFDIFYDSMPRFLGSIGRFRPIDTFRLRDKRRGITYTGEFALPKLYDFIPLKQLWGRPKLVHNCFVKNNSHNYAEFGLYEEGIGRKHYHIYLRRKERFDAFFFRDQKLGDCICIFLEDSEEQVAFITTRLSDDGEFCFYSLHLLDKFAEFADLLTVFTVYFNNWNWPDPVPDGDEPEVKRRFAAAYLEKFDPEWLSANFPE